MRTFALGSGLGALAAVWLCGCVSLLPATAPATLYRFGADPLPEAGQPGSPPVRLALGAIVFPRSSGSDGILTAEGDQTAYIAAARWVSPARILFEEAARRRLHDGRCGVALADLGAGSAGLNVLSLDVDSFEADYGRSGAAPTVKLALTARLTAPGGRLIDQRSFAFAEAAGDNSVSAIVLGFNKAVDRGLDEVGRWAAESRPSAPSH